MMIGESDACTFTLPAEASSRPAVGSPDGATTDPSAPADDCTRDPRVNMPKRRWTHIRVPVELAERCNRLAGEALTAYSEGRAELPGSMAEYVPAWFVIQSALDEQEARRERSRRPRRKRPV